MNIIHAHQELLVQFLAAIPPVALFLSFELLMAKLNEPTVRLEAQNSLAEIVREVRKKEAELDMLVRNRTETVEKLEGEIGRLTEQKGQLKNEIQAHSNGNSGSKASKSDTIGQARQQQTTKKQEAKQQLLEVIRAQEATIITGRHAAVTSTATK